MNFLYKAQDKSGEIFEGHLEAGSQAEAMNELQGRGWFVITCKDMAASISEEMRGLDDEEEGLFEKLDMLLRGTNVPLKVQVAFFRQMAIMTRSGMSAPQALTTVADYLDHPVLRRTVVMLRDYVEKGFPINRSMVACESFFDTRMIALTAAGEESGTVDKAFLKIADMLDKRAKLISKIKAAMFYPVFVIVFAIIVMALFVVVILPKFQAVFTRMKIKMPPLTQAIFEGSEFLRNNGWLIGAVLVGTFLFVRWLNKQEESKAFIDNIKLKIPLAKTIIMKASMAQSMQTLSSLAEAGVPLLRSLELARDSIYNEVVKRSFNTIAEGVMGGYPLSQATMSSGMFPLLVSQMMHVGESSGSLPEMLGYVADWYDEDMQNLASRITAIMEPLMIVLIGGIVMLVILAIFTPILTAIQTMGRPQM